MDGTVTIIVPEWIVVTMGIALLVLVFVQIVHVGAIIAIKWLDHAIAREAKKLYMRLGIKEAHPLRAVPDKAPAADYVKPDA